MESNMKVMMGNKQEEEEEENRRDDGGNLPPGFRFHPTDEELVAHYLTHKVLDSTFSARAIADVDLNKCEPWDLPAKAKMGEKEWYFFSLRDRKYPTGLRTNRATEAGYWKATGKDREIFRGRTTTLIGMKKTLVFYKGRAPKGEKSNWVMHEYRLEGKFSYYNLPKTAKEEWVVSRIFKKNISGGGKKNSLGLSATSCLNDLDSSALPPLLESPYVTPNAVNEGSRSLESESGSAREHVSCFSTPMETFKDYNAAGIKGFATRSSADQQRDALPADSAEISEIANIMRSSPYLQTILQLNDPLLNINTNSAISPFCNLGKQDNASHLFPHGILPSLPLYPMAGPNVNFPPRDHMNTQNNGLIPPNSILRALVDQFAGNGDPMSLKQCKMEQPSPSSFGNNKALRMPGDQWLNGLSSSSTSGSLQGNFGIAQQMQTAQPMVSISQDTCLSADMNPEISSVVSNQLNRTTYNENQGRPSSSAAAPVDLDCLWTY